MSTELEEAKTETGNPGHEGAVRIPNEYGCYCSPEEFCDECSVTVYPHIRELKGSGLSGHALRAEQTMQFRSFISRISR
jgi:hypothetical protein